MRLKHAFVLELYGTFQDEVNLYLMLELVRGGELFRRLHGDEGNDEIPLAANEAAFYAQSVAVTYEYIHALPVLYRDLKPENLLIDRSGYLKIVDWGFGKALEHGERTHTVCGTPEYMSPELVDGSGHAKSVDYWSLGVVL